MTQLDRIEISIVAYKPEKKLVASPAKFTGKNCRLNISKLERWILVIFGM